jgi:preprotein translocase subunit SecE
MENQQQKWVSLSFVAFSALMAFVLFSLGMKVSGVYDLETRVRNIELVMQIGSLVAGILLFAILYRNDRTNTFMTEVVVELSKVTWPTQRETSSATLISLIMVLISGVILFLLDSLWTYLLQLVIR